MSGKLQFEEKDEFWTLDDEEEATIIAASKEVNASTTPSNNTPLKPTIPSSLIEKPEEYKSWSRHYSKESYNPWFFSPFLHLSDRQVERIQNHILTQYKVHTVAQYNYESQLLTANALISFVHLASFYTNHYHVPIKIWDGLEKNPINRFVQLQMISMSGGKTIKDCKSTNIHIENLAQRAESQKLKFNYMRRSFILYNGTLILSGLLCSPFINRPVEQGGRINEVLYSSFGLMLATGLHYSRFAYLIGTGKMDPNITTRLGEEIFDQRAKVPEDLSSLKPPKSPNRLLEALRSKAMGVQEQTLTNNNRTISSSFRGLFSIPAGLACLSFYSALLLMRQIQNISSQPPETNESRE